MIEVRPATEADIESLYALMLAIAQYHDQAQYLVTDKTELSAALAGENPKFGALMATNDGEAVGYLSYTWNYSIWQGAEYMNLDDLFVKSDFRGQKVGLKLMEAAKALCQKQAIRLIRWEVETDNSRAIDFYQNLGAQMAEKGIFKWQLD